MMLNGLLLGRSRPCLRIPAPCTSLISGLLALRSSSQGCFFISSTHWVPSSFSSSSYSCRAFAARPVVPNNNFRRRGGGWTSSSSAILRYYSPPPSPSSGRLTSSADDKKMSTTAPKRQLRSTQPTIDGGQKGALKRIQPANGTTEPNPNFKSSSPSKKQKKKKAADDEAEAEAEGGAEVGEEAIQNDTQENKEEVQREREGKNGYASGKKSVSDEVNQSRVRVIKTGEAAADKKGPVVYWVSRDQRSRDNWALLHAVQEANKKGVAVAVVFNLVESFLEAKARHFGFMLRGLRVMEKNLRAVNIPFFLFRGKAEETVPAFVEKCDASTVVMDFSPLRIGREWREGISANVGPSVTVHEVDAHNVVPVWVTSDKMEHSARTIRTKIHKQLPQYLVEIPDLKPSKQAWTSDPPAPINWDQLIDDALSAGAEVPEVDWCEAGEDAAMEFLLGPKDGFLTKRLAKYEFRNDPTKPGSLSGISPYLHFGQISAQRAALEARKFRKSSPKSVDAFLEEMVIRRELSDNFCNYQPDYDNIRGAKEWAQKTLRDHASDKRDPIYTKEQLEKGKTHDKLWNASQLEMVHSGKMHGYMRMYWAKKILEWTSSAEEALSIAISLNDKYEIDGRDPNGYVGCMWSICGIHDQGWRERPIFGKIRFMNYDGCKRKFNVDGYIAQVDRIVSQAKKKKEKSSLKASS